MGKESKSLKKSESLNFRHINVGIQLDYKQ